MARSLIDETILLFEHGIDLKTNTLHWCSDESSSESAEVDGNFASKAIKGLHFLDNRSEKDINIILSGWGGCYYRAAAVYDAVRNCRAKIIISVFGPAFSSCSIIFQAADVRKMSRHSRLLLHYGELSLTMQSQAVRAWSDQNDKSNQEMENIYLSKIKEKNKSYKLDDLKKLLAIDAILSAEECLKLGLTDEVI